MLAPSNPSARNTTRAPSRIWTRFFSARAVTSIVCVEAWIIRDPNRPSVSFSVIRAGRHDALGRRDRTIPVEMREIELQHRVAGLDHPDLLLHQISQSAFGVHGTQLAHSISDLLKFAKRNHHSHMPLMVL